ncbi:hypothetical protein P7K49_028813 [Saguinus oedipus]|uniref:Uncharacterized protein n=1 Tax=Saguinus oedipus TaxID=9490 RepID=A0ABQ9U5E3_SAGOE|nr:hypothetical protein P7K49_028813 [Saguinus oedipus]
MPAEFVSTVKPNRSFEFAFELSRLALKHKTPEIHLKYAVTWRMRVNSKRLKLNSSELENPRKQSSSHEVIAWRQKTLQLRSIWLKNGTNVGDGHPTAVMYQPFILICFFHFGALDAVFWDSELEAGASQDKLREPPCRDTGKTAVPATRVVPVTHGAPPLGISWSVSNKNSSETLDAVFWDSELEAGASQDKLRGEELDVERGPETVPMDVFL